MIDLDSYVLDKDTDEYFSDKYNNFLTVAEYSRLHHFINHDKCDKCGIELELDELCWCNG